MNWLKVPTNNSLIFKLRQLDRPLAKFCLKSDLHHLLINFFDMIPAAWLICRDNLIWIQTQNLIWNLNLINNRSNLIKNGHKRLHFWVNFTISIEFDHFWLNNWHIDSLFQSFNQQIFKIDQFWLILIETISNFNLNSDCWLEIIIKIWIGQKLTID